MTDRDLKPCPFCGQHLDCSNKYTGQHPNEYGEKCVLRNMYVPLNNQDEVEAWNRRQDTWQTIESAPRDGRSVILYNGYVVVGWWDRKWINHEWNTMKPTHWRPLPEPPEVTP